MIEYMFCVHCGYSKTINTSDLDEPINTFKCDLCGAITFLDYHIKPFKEDNYE